MNAAVRSRPPLHAGVYALLAVGFLAFAVYGSWVPFHVQSVSWHDAVRRFTGVCSQTVAIRSLSDWVANVLLFVPIGFTMLASVSVDRHWSSGLWAVPVVLIVCLAASTAIEFSQVYFIGRVSSVNDVVAQAIGTGIGIVGWLAVGQECTDAVRRGWGSLSRAGAAATLLPAYLGFVLLAHLMPFDLTLSPADIYRKYRAGRVHLLPLDFGDAAFFDLLAKQLWNLIYFAPVGYLLARLERPVGSWGRVAAIGLGFGLVVQFAKLFVASRNVAVSDALVSMLAVLAGWAVAAVPVSGRRPLSDLLSPGWLLAGWSVIVVFLNWQPFDTVGGLDRAARRLAELSWLPFADYQTLEPAPALDQALHKMLLFAPFGALLVGLLPPPRVLLTMATALVLAVLVEAGQLFLATRYPSPSDVLLAVGGAWLGLLLRQRVATDNQLQNTWLGIDRRRPDVQVSVRRYAHGTSLPPLSRETRYAAEERT